MKRRDFQALAAVRLKEAQHLLRNRNWDGAYYLAGYAVECGLKACIAKQTERHEFPDKKKTDDSYTHDLRKLLKTADLEETLRIAETDPEFAKYWRAVRDWAEQSRYERWTQAEAEELLNAIRDRKKGVLRWLKEHW